jgi:hypothetical protein
VAGQNLVLLMCAATPWLWRIMRPKLGLLVCIMPLALHMLLL